MSTAGLGRYGARPTWSAVSAAAAAATDPTRSVRPSSAACSSAHHLSKSSSMSESSSPSPRRSSGHAPSSPSCLYATLPILLKCSYCLFPSPNTAYVTPCGRSAAAGVSVLAAACGHTHKLPAHAYGTRSSWWPITMLGSRAAWPMRGPCILHGVHGPIDGWPQFLLQPPPLCRMPCTRHARAMSAHTHLEAVFVLPGLSLRAEPCVEVGGVVGGLAVAVRRHHQHHELLLWQALLTDVVLHVEDVDRGGVAVPRCQLLTQLFCEPLRRARLRAVQQAHQGLVGVVRSCCRGRNGCRSPLCARCRSGVLLRGAPLRIGAAQIQQQQGAHQHQDGGDRCKLVHHRQLHVQATAAPQCPLTKQQQLGPVPVVHC
jgi:hypothetical protein